MEHQRSIPMDLNDYNDYVERMRRSEYPMLKDTVYLDHAGTTLYGKSLMERFHADMMASLYGNPHSASLSSQKSTQEIETVRIQLLQLFNADPEHFDLVFTANATAGIRLVADAFREFEDGFSYCYHVDSHTSLVGVRELAMDYRCLECDNDVEDWIGNPEGVQILERPTLFAYPAQSNMNGKRLSLDWADRLRQSYTDNKVYTLLDAAAYVSTSPLDLGDSETAPDFTVLSLYKIFGFPDLGALIVRKAAEHVFDRRRYFGGGTVDMVACLKEQWHAKKSGALHERLEHGTLPVHSIVALKLALQTHEELFRTLDQVSRHTANLAKRLYDGLCSLRHGNFMPVCTIYKDKKSKYGDNSTQGPVIAFNMRDSKGHWVSNTEVEKLASIRNIHLRTGGVCNPGGIATTLELAPWEIRENFSAGHRCGSENDILNGKPTGVIRLSLGAMSTRSDVDRFLAFLNEFFVDTLTHIPEPASMQVHSKEQHFHVESLTVYPIKSCGGWQIPYDQSWDIRPEGLAWDREWCIVHQATGKALSQKQHPRMALLRPRLDFNAGTLRVGLLGSSEEISVPLSRNPKMYATTVRDAYASVCGDHVKAFTYISPGIANFFTRAIGVACTLARFNPASKVSRHSKARLIPQGKGHGSQLPRPIMLSNESPILAISRSSLNRLNEQIKSKGGKAAHPSVFRANIVLAESPLLSPGQEQPWAEDGWSTMRIGGDDGPVLEFLGGCRRCQMVCVDQENAEKNGEPFVTLAKTRRFEGRVLFGVHTTLASPLRSNTSIKVGDLVETFVE